MIPKTYDKRIEELATSIQKEYYKDFCEFGSYVKVADKWGRNESAIRRSLNALEKKAVSSGLIKSCDGDGIVGAGRMIGKVTTQVRDGEVVQEWIRSDEQKIAIEERMEFLRQAIEDQTPVRDYTIEGPEFCDEDLMSVYPMGDPHLGMYAWAEESGQDFDCDICEQRIVKAIDRLVDTQPYSAVGRIENLGDFFHADNEDARTRKSGNNLDVDGRWARVYQIGVRILTHCIDRCLEKHERVELVCVPGNHDNPELAYMLACTIDVYYRNDDRVWVDLAYRQSFYKEWGKVLIGCNHGMTKPIKLQQEMAVDMSEAWGRTKYRYWHVGHIHHMRAEEVGGVEVEAFRTLAAKDAYAARSGYRAGQDMHALLYHKKYGRIERSIRNVQMLEDA